MADATTVVAVAAYMKLTDTSDVVLTDVVAAVNALLVSWFGNLTDAVSLEWPANYQLGATMLAARVYRRRNSPAGVEAFGELGPTYVMRNDPDVALLLGLHSYLKPKAR